MKVKPLQDKVLVKPDEVAEKTAGGIIIPDTSKEKQQIGTVVAVGPGKKDEPTVCKVGDKVVFKNYSGAEVQIDSEKFVVLSETTDILLIL